MHKLHTLFQRLIHWVKTHRTASIAIAGVLLIAIVGGVTYAVVNRPVEEPPVAAPSAAPEPEPITYYSPLTGIEVADDAATKAAVTAIMFGNSIEARPQSGLKDAGIVYEAIAEGGITRLLALYQESKPDLVGPVRSLRLYNVEWVAPYNASVAHVGGSAAALREVRNGSYRDIDQFFNAGTYWRSTDRWAPHNVYTNFERIDALNQSKGYVTSNFTGFARKDSEAVEQPNATRLNVTMSGPAYNTQWDYQASTNTYHRSIGGAPHNDREKGRISPRVVVVMQVPMTLVNEDGQRQNYQTSGNGRAWIFQDGTVQQVSWRKASRQAPLHFVDGDGNDVELARGQTWINAVPAGSGGVSWQ